MAIRYSSITKKVIMALMGLFLIMFLFVHVAVNLLVLINDNGETFNKAAHFMGTNPIIQFMQIFLFGGFFIHILTGIVLQVHNWLARPKRYKIEAYSEMSVTSKFMIHTGLIVLSMLVFHLFNFFFTSKFGHMEVISYGGQVYDDMAGLIITKFTNPTYVFIYILWLLFLGFHLDHAFHSGFQTLGWNHDKYTPLVFVLSRIIAIVLTVGFITIPVTIYFF